MLLERRRRGRRERWVCKLSHGEEQLAGCRVADEDDAFGTQAILNLGRRVLVHHTAFWLPVCELGVKPLTLRDEGVTMVRISAVKNRNTKHCKDYSGNKNECGNVMVPGILGEPPRSSHRHQYDLFPLTNGSQPQTQLWSGRSFAKSLIHEEAAPNFGAINLHLTTPVSARRIV